MHFKLTFAHIVYVYFKVMAGYYLCVIHYIDFYVYSIKKEFTAFYSKLRN